VKLDQQDHKEKLGLLALKEISVRLVHRALKDFKVSQVKSVLRVLREKQGHRDPQDLLAQTQLLLALWVRQVLKARLVLLVQQFFGTLQVHG
jgi:hypothetical protein